MRGRQQVSEPNGRFKPTCAKTEWRVCLAKCSPSPPARRPPPLLPAYTASMTTDSSEVDAARLLAQVPDAVIFADLDGVIRTWNAAAQRVFGHSEADAVGQTLDLIVPERFREAHWGGWERAIQDRITKYVGQSLPTRSMNAAGEQITVELSFAIVLDEAGASVGALATARDISERWDRDRATRNQLKELEAELATLRGTEGASA